MSCRQPEPASDGGCGEEDCEKAATESEMRVAVRDGMPPLEAYERFGTF